MAGAAAVSDVLGPLGVPLAGLSIGVGALVGNFEALKANADHTVEVFTKISDAVNNKGFTVDKGVLKAMPGAVITEINLLNKTVTFGDMTIQPSTSVTNDMPAGGWDGFALGGPHEDAHGTPPFLSMKAWAWSIRPHLRGLMSKPSYCPPLPNGTIPTNTMSPMVRDITGTMGKRHFKR